jgi:hypothetical protein
MLTLRTTIAILCFGLITSASGSSSGADKGVIHISASRAAAIRECNERSNKYAQYVWGVTQLHIYRTCMARLHQVE